MPLAQAERAGNAVRVPYEAATVTEGPAPRSRRRTARRDPAAAAVPVLRPGLRQQPVRQRPAQRAGRHPGVTRASLPATPTGRDADRDGAGHGRGGDRHLPRRQRVDRHVRRQLPAGPPAHQDGQTVAVGVVTGELVTDDGRSLGVGSRRHTAAAELTSTADAFHVQVGPVELTLLGCLVTVDVVAVTVPRDLPTTPGVPEVSVTGAELPRYGVSAAEDATA